MKVLITRITIDDNRCHHLSCASPRLLFKCDEFTQDTPPTDKIINENSQIYRYIYTIIEVNVEPEFKTIYLKYLTAHLTEASENRDNQRGRSYQHHADEVLILMSWIKPEYLLAKFKKKVAMCFFKALDSPQDIGEHLGPYFDTNSAMALNLTCKTINKAQEDWNQYVKVRRLK